MMKTICSVSFRVLLMFALLGITPTLMVGCGDEAAGTSKEQASADLRSNLEAGLKASGDNAQAKPKAK